jgi:hypothetical protein
MRRTLVPAILCLSIPLAAPSISPAQTGGKPPGKTAAAPPAGSAAMPMKPQPEMDKVKWLVGTWQCTGKTMASPMWPEHPVEATVVADMTLDGFWILSHYKEKKTAQNTMPISGDEYWSYDGAEKMWDRVSVDNMGGFGTATAKGWEKGKLVWTGDALMGGQKMKVRDTFTEKNPREVTYSGEIGTPDGKWAAAWEATCKK